MIPKKEGYLLHLRVFGLVLFQVSACVIASNTIIVVAQIARGSAAATALITGGGRSKSGRRKSQGGGSSGNTRTTPVTMNGQMGQTMGTMAASCSGESDEYDDSCGSESDECFHLQHQQQQQLQLQQQHQHLVMGMLGPGESTMSKACRYSAIPIGQAGGIYGQAGGRPIFLNDETLLVSDKDRKSLPRGLRPK